MAALKVKTMGVVSATPVALFGMLGVTLPWAQAGGASSNTTKAESSTIGTRRRRLRDLRTSGGWLRFGVTLAQTRADDKQMKSGGAPQPRERADPTPWLSSLDSACSAR